MKRRDFLLPAGVMAMARKKLQSSRHDNLVSTRDSVKIDVNNTRLSPTILLEEINLPR